MANQLCTFEESYQAAVRSMEHGSDYHAAIAKALKAESDDELRASMAEVQRLGNLIAGEVSGD